MWGLWSRVGYGMGLLFRKRQRRDIRVPALDNYAGSPGRESKYGVDSDRNVSMAEREGGFRI